MPPTNRGDADLVRLVLDAATAESAEKSLGELVAQHASSAGSEVGELLVQMVVRARELRQRLAVLEVEAANQAREAGITARRLSEATGISERNVRQRFRRSSIDTAHG